MSWMTLVSDNPNDVGVTRTFSPVGKRPPPSSRSYVNTLLMTPPVSINANANPAVALATQNFARALLIMQNESFATIAGDVAPTMYFGFGMSPTIGSGIALPPGVGIVLDVRVPANAIYVAIGPSINTSGSVVVQGIVQEGGISNPELDTVNITETGQLAQLVKLLLSQMRGAQVPAA